MALSSRAVETAKSSVDMLIWDVVSDAWHPDDNSDGYVSLGIAENTLMHEELSKHIHQHLTLPTKVFTYGDGPPGSKRLKRAMACFLNKHLKPFTNIEPEHVSLTNGCSSAIEHLSWAIANPGEAFLLGQPFYGAFIPDIAMRFETQVLPVPFHDVDPLGNDCVRKYEEVLLDARNRDIKVAGLIISHPHNPLGRCYSSEVIIGLMRLCEKYKMHFVSDEIYALSVFANTVDEEPPAVPFVSALSIDPADIINPARIHIMWGMSKDFGANGIRLGAIISQRNPVLQSALLPVAVYSGMSSLTQHVTTSILEDFAWTAKYIEENQMKLAKQYEYAVAWAKQKNVEYAPGVNAAFFLWINLGKIYMVRNPSTSLEQLDETTNKVLLDQKVFLASGKGFGSESPGWFRMVFSHEIYHLEEGLQRIEKALGF